MRVLTILGGILAALVTAILVTFLAARFHDGPLGIVPSGPLADAGVWYFSFASRSS